MSQFTGNFVNGLVENHVFSSSHKEMEAIGMHSFTIGSCADIWNKNQNNLSVILNKSVSTLSYRQTIFEGGGLGIGSVTGTYVYYDKISEVLTTGTKSYSDWKTLITYHEDRARGGAENKSNDKIIRDVQTSVNGAVKFTFSENVFSSSLSGDVNVFLKFFKRNWDTNEDKDARVPGIAANMPVVGIPTTVGGTEYSENLTRENAAADNVGKKISVAGGGAKNPKNTVAAPVDYYLNRATGKYESGNRRVLAILLTDIEPAPLRDINVSEQDLGILNPVDFTNNSTDLFTSYLAPTGLAMPVEVQNNNPNLFGPNFVKNCKDGSRPINRYEPETLVVTNRWRKSYKKGTTVFLTRVGHEWIVEEQPQDPALSPLKLGEWTFSKLIASSDEYFKDNGWVGGTSTFSKVTPSQYEEAARRKFYNNAQSFAAGVIGAFWSMSAPVQTFVDLNNSGTSPAYITNFVPSTYYISTIFDQLPPAVGGLSDAAWIGRTNINKGIPTNNYMEEVGVFWGPVYVEGYDSVTLKLPPETGRPAGYTAFYNPAANNATPWTSLATPANLNIAGNNYTPTKYDLPAECTSKILDPRFLWLNYNSLGNRSNNGIIPSAIKPPYYESKKTSNNKIQFIPLTANFVGANDPNASNAFLSYERNFKDRMNEFFTNYYGRGVSSTMWGYMHNRTSNTLCAADSTGGVKRSTCGLKGGFTPVSDYLNKFPKYDCYICRDADNPPLGFPENMFNTGGSSQGANCVGIICGRNTVSKRGGGNINFTVTSNFGFAPFSSISAGNFFLGILPIGGIAIPLLTSNEARQSRGKPQFGAYSDDIYSFGTTTLAVRVFDGWPEELTAFDPRYFAVLHFNPGELGSLPTTSQVPNPNGAGNITVDNLTTSVDFRIPTASGNPGPIMSVGTVVTSGTAMRPRDYWRVNTIRRGMMLTAGGFKYPKVQVGANTMAIKTITGPPAKTFSGKGYAVDQKFTLNNELKIKVTAVDSNGGITGFTFDVDDDGYQQRGDFTSSDFPDDMTVPLPRDNDGKIISGAEAAIITVTNGIVYSVLKKDIAPVEHVPLKTISSSNKGGTAEVVNETLTTTVGVAKNTSGKYDIFTHFHNDITHTLMYHPLYGKTTLQHITVDIT